MSQLIETRDQPFAAARQLIRRLIDIYAIMIHVNTLIKNINWSIGQQNIFDQIISRYRINLN